MRKSIRLLVLVVGTLGAVIGAALGIGPAWAAGCPTGVTTCQNGSITATATVTSTMTFTLSATSFSFGSGNVGATLGTTAAPTTSSPAPFTATVVTNDNLGYQIDAEAPALTSGSSTIAATNLKTAAYLAGSTSPSNGVQTMTSPESFVPVVGSSAASGTGGDVYGMQWQLAIPTTAAPGSYSTTIEYAAVAS